ncbi:bacteriophage abortive infection AbiH family protein [Lactococcus lactis subsp. lactis]|uniref:AbiH family protein n=1 Tax=Lactococcus lactis TaxID=1358 RepID=UPI0012933D31|nr:AbiH family protein [Lactococcus lactis]MQQ80493.1 hypothetical protein [Lactococcus lactis]
MRQLLILGNGFDLACGLKSSYTDFIKYMKREHHIERKLPQSYSDDDNISEVNIWYTLLLFSNLSGDVTWKEIETQIYKWLVHKEIIEKIIKTHTFKTMWNISTNQAEMSRIKQGINEKIYLAALKRIERMNNEESEIDREVVAKILLSELNRLEKDFENYLFLKAGYSIESDGIYFTKSNDLLRKIVLENYPELTYKPDNSINELMFNVISFNYTDPWSSSWRNTFNISSALPKPILHSMVHGLAFRDQKNEVGNNRVIFGVDSFKYISEDKETEISPLQLEYRFTKIYRTLVLYSDKFRSYSKRNVHLNVFDKEIKEIKFYGHSLGEADYSYFQQMFDYYDLYSNNELVLYFYYSQYPNSNKTDQELLQEQVYSITKLIEKYGSTMNNKAHGKNLLTRLLQTNRIIIKEI